MKVFLLLFFQKKKRFLGLFPRRRAMDQAAVEGYISSMNIGTRIFTMLNGRVVGRDAIGNVYYEDRKLREGSKRRRWVDYKGEPEASAVPAEWHAWLHYTVDVPLPETGRKVWQKPHQPNLTGSADSYRPAGHDYVGGKRAAATGDYESWTPGS